MKAIIVEDEKLAARRLVKLINEVAPNISIEGIFEGVIDTEKYLRKNLSIQIVFLDIHLADGDAFDLIEKVEINCPIIFTTAYDQYVRSAFQKNAFDYLLKPIRKNELKEVIDKVSTFIGKTDGTKSSFIQDDENGFLIRFGSRYHMVKVIDVAYAYNREGISIIVTKSGKSLPVNISLQEIKVQLGDKNFFFVNPDFLTHLDSIRMISSDYEEGITLLSMAPPLDWPFTLSGNEYKNLQEYLDE